MPKRKLEGHPTTPLAQGCSYFIESHYLGAIETAARGILGNPLSRSRRVELNHIQQVLKTLRLIPEREKVVALGLGCLDNGKSGLVVVCSLPIHVQGHIPPVQPKEPK